MKNSKYLGKGKRTKKVTAAMLKRSRKLAVAFMKNHFVVNLPNHPSKVSLIFNKNGNKVLAPKYVTDALIKEPLKWTVHGYFLGRDNQGNQYIVSMYPINFDHPVLYSHVAQPVSEGISKVMREDCNVKHYISGAWIAVSEGREVTEEFAFDLFLKHGAFDHKSNWERQKEADNVKPYKIVEEASSNNS